MFRPVLSRRFVTLAVAAAAAAGAGIGVGSLSACSSGGGQPVGTAPAAATAPAPVVPAQPTQPTQPASPAPSSPLTADQASAIAVQASPGTVTEVEQDAESTGPVFDVKVQHADGSETKVQVDATTGRVISTETDGADTPNDPTDQPGDGH